MSYSRRQVIGATAGFAAFVATSANAENSSVQRRSSDMDLDIKRNGSRPSAKGSPDWFTGSVRVDPLFQRRIRRGRAVVSHLRTRRPDGVAYASARPDPDHHGRS